MGEPEQRFSSTCSRAENALLPWATMGGSCAHPDQSPLLAHTALRRNDLWVRTSAPILLFFILGGVPIHDGLLSGANAQVEMVQRYEEASCFSKISARTFALALAI